MANFKKINYRRIYDYSVVTFFGAGLFPKAPGTIGSAAAAIVFLIPVDYLSIFLWIIIPIYFFLSLPSISRIEAEVGDDPGFVVADEVVGMWIIWASPFIPREPVWIFVGFLLFRFFDILKPFPISLLDKRKGAFFVMADDVAGALISSFILHLFYFAYLVAPFAWIYFFGEANVIGK